MVARNPVKALGAFQAQEEMLQSYLPLPPSPFENLHILTHSTETTKTNTLKIQTI